MNSKKISIILLTVSLFAILFGNVAIAENCPNIVGDWVIAGKEVCNVPDETYTDQFDYRFVDMEIVINYQDGCLFDGYVDY